MFKLFLEFREILKKQLVIQQLFESAIVKKYSKIISLMNNDTTINPIKNIYIFTVN